MRKFKHIILIVLCFACKEEKKVETVKEDVSITKDIKQEKTDELDSNWLYVNAENGLNVRDKNGEVLKKFLNATPINVVGYTEDIIKVVDNGETIKGRKAIIDFYGESGKEAGYLFEGYLTRIEGVKIYESELCKHLEYIVNSGYNFSEPRCLKEVLKLEIIPANYKAEFIDVKPNIINENAIKKVNNIIELPTKKGSVKIESFPATAENEKQIVYEYLGELPLINSYLISGEYYEGGDYRIYDKIEGKETITLNSIPSFSPDGKKMIAIGFNPYEPSGEFEIATIVNKKIINLRHFSFVNWTIIKDTEINWIDENTFIINVVHTRAYYDQKNGKNNKNGTLLKVTIL